MTMVNPDSNQPMSIPSRPSQPGSALSACSVWLATAAGFTLSIASILKICSACSETAAFTIFGMDFGWFGIGYFLLLAALLLIRRWFAWADWLAVSLLFAAAGAESRFIWLQKYVIGQWCPICLWIAASVCLGCAAKTYETSVGHIIKGAGMKSRVKLFIVVCAMTAIGLVGAIVGVKKESEAAELDLFLGKAKSPVTVYFISDWFCPGCRKIEPAIEKMFPEIARSARVSFVDFPIHKETLNFTPFNLQFLYFEKGKYIPLRRALGELAIKTKNPAPEEVQAAIAHLGVKLRQVNYSDILYGMQANLSVYRGFNINSTPSVVVTNTKTKKTKVLVGERQISEQAVKSAIDEVAK